jgi:hypothetical protein
MQILDLISISRIPVPTVCGCAFPSSLLPKSNNIGISWRIVKEGMKYSKVIPFVR